MPDVKKGALALCLSALACGAMDAGYARSVLDRDALLAGNYRRSVDLSAYAPPQDAMPPSNRFEGRLRLSGQPSTRTLVASPDYLEPDDASLARTVPQDFDYEFVRAGEALIPVRRGPIPSNHPWWEFVLEPGRVWDEPGDDGYTRAAIPFALVQRNANCTHNGVLMFLFKDNGAVSRAALQVSSETCHYLQLDMWGALEASYEPGKVADSDVIVAAYQTEVARRMPSRPPLSVGDRPSGGGSEQVRHRGSPGTHRHGVVFEGVHYRSGCATRHGQYPYCDVLDIPSYSLAKSAVAGLALMRMERLHPGTQELQVDQFAPATGCRSEKWRGVTFRHLLDMTTGQYDAPTYMADEDNVRVRAFFAPSTHAQRLAFACEAYPRHESPGSRWVYHSSDTYLLGTVLQAAWRRLPGKANDDVFDDLLWADVFGPMGMSPTARATRRSDDEARQAFFGWGLTLHTDDIAKLARFLGPEHGSIHGRELLDTGMFEVAMQRDPDNPGLRVATLDRYRYQHGSWARNLQAELACDRATWVPH